MSKRRGDVRAFSLFGLPLLTHERRHELDDFILLTTRQGGHFFKKLLIFARRSRLRRKAQPAKNNVSKLNDTFTSQATPPRQMQIISIAT
ncbi:MAG: hypothetical protein R2684_12130 [Pyrinomonadaceae bacterium]